MKLGENLFNIVTYYVTVSTFLAQHWRESVRIMKHYVKGGFCAAGLPNQRGIFCILQLLLVSLRKGVIFSTLYGDFRVHVLSHLAVTVMDSKGKNTMMKCKGMGIL